MPKVNIPPIDPLALFRKTQYNDQHGTTITEVCPVYASAGGAIVQDPIRQLTYEGLCFGPGGQPITFRIEGAINLFDACAKFPAAMQAVADEIESQQTRARILAANQSRPPRAPR